MLYNQSSFLTYVYVHSLCVILKSDKKEEDEPSTSANPVLELELTEEKLPMTLSRQEVSQTGILTPTSQLFFFPKSHVAKCMSCIIVFVQVIRRLRERGEPIRLFGESDYDAFQRLRKIEILAPEVNKVGLSHSWRWIYSPLKHNI